MDETRELGHCKCGSDHTSNLSQEDTRAIARILFAVHQRQAAERLAAEAAAASRPSAP